MRDSIHDYAIKFEKAKDLKHKLLTKGLASLPSEKVKQSHWPSELAMCMRKRYYAFKGAVRTNPFDVQTKMTFELGHAIDDIVAKLAMRARVYVEDEFSYSFKTEELKYPISGRIDIVLEEDDGTLVPAEVKSINSNQFDDRTLHWLPGKPVKPGANKEPKIYHVAQLMTYIYYMGTDFGYLIYLNKDSSELEVFKVFWSQELFDDTIKDCITVEKHVELDTPPKRIAEHNLEFYQRDSKYGNKGDLKIKSIHFPCGYQKSSGEISMCEFFDVCHADKILESDDASDEYKEKVKRAIEMQKV